MVLKGCFYVRTSLCRLRMSHVFHARAGFGMDTSHIFPQGVLAVIPWTGGVVGVVVSRACAGYEMGLPLLPPWQGWGLPPPSCWIRSPEGWVLSGSIALECEPCLKGGDAEASEDLCTAYTGSCSSAQKLPRVTTLSLLCLSQI